MEKTLIQITLALCRGVMRFGLCAGLCAAVMRLAAFPGYALDRWCRAYGPGLCTQFEHLAAYLKMYGGYMIFLLNNWVIAPNLLRTCTSYCYV